MNDQNDQLKKPETNEESSDLDAVLDSITKNKTEETGTGELESDELSALLGETETSIEEEKSNLNENVDQFEDYNALLFYVKQLAR